MGFIETVRRARELLREEGRITLRGLKREFDLSDDALEELIEELVAGQQVAARKGTVVSWIGRAGAEAETLPVTTASPPEPTAEAEHRQLTVMFCDLVDSTEFSERLDAEDLAEVVAAYQQMCVASIESFDGHVAQYLGDGLLVYFGYPMAHEDDAARAVHAALRIVHDSPRLSERLAHAHPALRGRPLQQRIGIHTGPVLVGEMGAGETRENLALGVTVNVAARLEARAEPGSILLSGATRHLVHGAFVFEALGERSLKGVADPVPVFRPVQPTGVRSRLALAGASGLTPLVGREQQVGILLERWEEAKAGHGQVVFLSGEAGMGKSRLIEVLREHVADEPHTWHEYRGSAYHQSSAFHPIIELIERAVMFTETDAPEERVEKLARALGYSGFPTEEILPLIADFLGLPKSENLPPLALSPEARRRRTLETIAVWPVALSQRQPVIMIAEDLHWYDPSSLEVAGMAIEQVPAAPVLLIATFRPEFEPPWPGSSRWMHLPLQPLTHKHIEAMVGHIARGKPLPLKVREQITAKTDGVPLFVEELTKSVLESDLVVESDERHERTDPLPSLAIPMTLRDSLTARLDRLGPAKVVAQLGSVLGREFSYDVLRLVSPLEPAALDQALGELVGAGFLYPRGIPPLATYIFKHALIHEAAHQSLLKKRRREHNALIARALEEHFPARAASEPEVLARHYEDGGLAGEAIVYYARAGEKAQALCAYEEAVRHLRQASALVAAQPESRERDAHEAALQLQLAFSSSAIASRGYAQPEVEVAFERARVLCEAIGDSRGLGRALDGLADFSVASGQMKRAGVLAMKVLAIAERIDDTDMALRGHYELAQSEFYRGRFASSLRQCEAALALFEPGRRQVVLPEFPSMDRDVPRLYLSAWSLYELGWPDRARDRAREAVVLARAIRHPYSLTSALVFAAVVDWSRRDVAGQRERAAEAMAVSETHGFPFWLGVARTFHASARVAAGELEAVADLVAGVDQSGGTGTRNAAPGLLGLLGESYIAAGQLSQARRAVEGGLAIGEQTDQSFFDAELHRLRGEIDLAGGGSADDAEALFQRALEIARTQEARSYELRTATSLARLWRDQGKLAEARNVLASVYDWFTEGFDTQDLKDAKALLEELA